LSVPFRSLVDMATVYFTASSLDGYIVEEYAKSVGA
jgi:hypothetical protein